MLLSLLKGGRKVVGARQTMRALNAGAVQAVFLAADADPLITGPVVQLAQEMKVPIHDAGGTRALGAACGIKVPAAVAALLH